MTSPREAWNKLQASEAWIAARVRACIMAVGLSGAMFGQELASALEWPWLGKYLRILGAACGAISVLIRAGDKTTTARVYGALDGATKPPES